MRQKRHSEYYHRILLLLRKKKKIMHRFKFISQFVKVTFAIVFIIAMNSCSADKNNGNIESSDLANCTTIAPRNPNGNSELAILMRAMLDSSSSLKASIKQGKLPEKFPDAFLKIHTATPTDPTVKTPQFDAFAASYVEGLNQLYNSAPEDYESNYNSLVQRCANCHRAVCPGPLKAINKLWIEG